MTSSLIGILSNTDLKYSLITTKNNVINKDEFKNMNFFSKILFQINFGRVDKDKVFSKLAEQARAISYFAENSIYHITIGNEKFILNNSKDCKDLERIGRILNNLEHLTKIKLKDDQSVTDIHNRITSINTSIFMEINNESQVKDTVDEINKGTFDMEIKKSKVPYSGNAAVKEVIESRILGIKRQKEKIIESASNWKKLLDIYNKEEDNGFNNLICERFKTAITNIPISSKGHLDLYKELDQFVNNENFIILPREIRQLAKGKLDELKRSVLKPVNIADLPKVANFLNIAEYPSYIGDVAENNIKFYIGKLNFVDSELEEIIRNENNQFGKKIQDIAIQHKDALTKSIDAILTEISPMVIQDQLEIEGHDAKASILYY